MNTFEAARYERQIKLAMIDHPYGDPFGGPAYGQFEKSKGLGMIIGVVGSVVTMGAALPMLASASLATQIAGGAMMAGGVLSGVGAVTGNKKLMKVGGVLSLAGGIGAGLSSMTNGLGMGAGSTGVQNMAGSMMESINGMGVNVFNPELIASATSAGQTAGTVSLAGEAANVVGGVGESVLPNVEGTGLGGSADVAKVGVPDTGGQVPLAGADPSATAKPGIIQQASAPDQGFLGNGLRAPGAGPVSPGSAAGAGGAAGKETGILGFMQKNPELTKIGGEMIKGFASGALSEDKQEVMDALAEKYKGEVRLINTQADYAAYVGNNAKAQVAMISADDPQLDAKVQEAKSKGVPVAFIPTIGANFNASQPKAWGAGTTSAGTTAAQTPARPATFAPQGA